MKTTAILIVLTFPLSSVRASTVVTGTPLETGIPYRHTITMSAADSASVTRHVGAWSWEDDSLFNSGNGEPPVGWTHTSDWVALTLLQPAQFTLRLDRQEGVAAPTAENPGNIAGTTSMFPSFSIYGGWDNDGVQDHTYNNRGAIGWASVTYLDHVDNSTQTSASRTWDLPAGNFTVALGSNAPATDTNRQGYLLTLTTVVPEPASAGLAAFAAAFLMRRRR